MNEASDDKQSAESRVLAPAANLAATLERNIRKESSKYFGSGETVVAVKISRIEEGRVSGILKVQSQETHENLLLDFRATSTPQGTISSLEVDVEGMKRNPHPTSSNFNSLKEMVAAALVGDRSAQGMLKRKIAAGEIKVDELRPEVVKSAIGYALGRLRSVRNQEKD